MTDFRKKFTENAEQFDGLMVGMLAENDMLKKALAGCRHAACYSVGESEALADQLRKVREIASRALES